MFPHSFELETIYGTIAIGLKYIVYKYIMCVCKHNSIWQAI